jgi:hypothetical protein
MHRHAMEIEDMTPGDEVLVEEWQVRLHGPSELMPSDVAVLVDRVNQALLDAAHVLAETLRGSGSRMSISGLHSDGSSPETS